MKKRITMILAVACCLALLVGSFAFFTDRYTTDTTATAGNIDLVWEDVSVNEYQAAAGDAVIGNNEYCQNDVWDKHSLVTADGIINPGDAFDMSYKLSNDGSKSIDVRQRIVLVSDVELTSEEAAEYHLTITGGNDTAAVAGKLQDDKKTIIYDLKDIILNGSKETTEENAVAGNLVKADNVTYTVRFDFEKEALNRFMESTVTIDLFATAKQHRNTVVEDFPAFEALGSVTNGAEAETIGTKVIEKIG